MTFQFKTIAALAVLLPSVVCGWVAPAFADSPLTQPAANTPQAEHVGKPAYTGKTTTANQALSTVDQGLDAIASSKMDPVIGHDVLRRVDSAILNLADDQKFYGWKIAQQFEDGLKKLEGQAKTGSDEQWRVRVIRGAFETLRQDDLGVKTSNTTRRLNRAMEHLSDDPAAMTLAGLVAAQNGRWTKAARLVSAAETHPDVSKRDNTYTRKLLGEAKDYLRLNAGFRRAESRVAKELVHASPARGAGPFVPPARPGFIELSPEQHEINKNAPPVPPARPGFIELSPEQHAINKNAPPVPPARPGFIELSPEQHAINKNAPPVPPARPGFIELSPEQHKINARPPVVRGARTR